MPKWLHFSTFFNILGGGRPELNTMPPIVGFSDMFFIPNQHLEVLRYGQDRWYNFGDHHPHGYACLTPIVLVSFFSGERELSLKKTQKSNE